MGYEWREITNGTFKGFVFHVATPTPNLNTHGQSSGQVTTPRKIQKITRPFQNGQRARDLGKGGATVTSEIIFFGQGYKRQFERFFDVLNEGTSGVLILPDREALNMMVETIVESSDADNGNSKTVSVTWTEDEISADQIAFGASVGFLPKGLIDAVNKFGELVENVQDVIANNPILATIEQLEAVVSSAVNSVVLATSLPRAVRDRVLQTVANMEQAFDTVGQSFNQLLGLFDTSEPGQTSLTTSTSTTAATGVATTPGGAIVSVGAPGSGFESGRFDEETGQPIEDGLIDEVVVEAEDVLAEEERAADVLIDVKSLETEEGLQDLEDQTIALLTASIETIQTDTVGRTQDIADATEDVINAVRDVIKAAKPVRAVQVVTPFELSLPEIMFANDVDLSTIDDILEKNTFLDDPNVVPGNTVITL